MNLFEIVRRIIYCCVDSGHAIKVFLKAKQTHCQCNLSDN